MADDKSQTFLEWLSVKLKERNLTENQLAKKANIGHSNFTRARNKGILPKWDVCYKISRALDVSPYEVFRAAGLMPPSPQIAQQERIDRLVERMQSVPEDRWDLIFNIIDVVITDIQRHEK